MNRRDFLSAAAAAALAEPLRAQSRPPLGIDAYSRHLQWLRSAAEVAGAAKEMGYDGLDITVRPKPGHVDPARVAQELPSFVKTVREHGLRVTTLALANIADADSPNLEDILRTASDLDIRYYWGVAYRYDSSKPVTQQLESIKPKIARLAALSAKYKVTAMVHSYSGNAVGAAIWDLLEIFRGFDPAHIGFHYDIGHMTNAGGNGTWITALRAAAPYIAGVSVKDSYIEPGNWRVRYVPLGEGNVRLDQFASILKEINFAGPIEIQAEYPNGGAENAADKITLPRDQVLGAMKKDQETLRAALHKAGFA